MVIRKQSNEKFEATSWDKPMFVGGALFCLMIWTVCMYRNLTDYTDESLCLMIYATTFLCLAGSCAGCFSISYYGIGTKEADRANKVVAVCNVLAIVSIIGGFITSFWLGNS